MAGQVIKRGDRTWVVRVYLGPDPQTGKRVYQNCTVHGTKRDAETKLNEMLRDRDLGLTVHRADTSDVNSLLDALVEEYRTNRKSADWAALVVRVHLRPFFGNLPIAKMSTDLARRYITMRQQAGIANATINRELALLRRSFSLGFRSTPPKVARVPFIPALEENNVRKGFFEDHQYRAVLDALPDYVQPIVAFAYFTGCRKGEILSIKWPQVDLAEGLVRLEAGQTKNDEARIVPLVPELIQILAKRKVLRDTAHSDCPWVFYNEGQPIRSFRNAWDRACRKAGLVTEEGGPARIFHDLRRTGVRNLVRAGVPENVAMKISGHKTRAVFDRYNIVSEADIKLAAERLHGHIAQKRKKIGR